MTDIRPSIDRIVARFSEAAKDPDLPARTLQFTFSDSGETWVLRYGDGKPAACARGSVEKPDVAVTVATDVLAGIVDKTIDGAAAFMQRKVQVKGAMDDLFRLQKLLM